MLLQQKHKNTLLLGFSLLLIAYFIGIRAFFLVHQFSHQNISVQKVLENKNITTQASNQESQDDQNSCLICYLANLYQHNILLVGGLVLSLTLFYLNQLFALKNKIKLSYLLCSYQSKAPPVVL
jgi:hypothetical protein